MKKNLPEKNQPASSPASLERELDDYQDAVDDALDLLRSGKLDKAIETLAEYESDEDED